MIDGTRLRVVVGWAVAWVVALSVLATPVRVGAQEAGRSGGTTNTGVGAKGEAGGKGEAAAKSVVAVFDLDQPVTETPLDESFPLFSPPAVSLKDLTTRMRKAGEDPSVKAVVLVAEATALGHGQLEEVRQVIKGIRAKGKDVLVHSDSMPMGQYVLFSGASRVSVVPTADLWVVGISGEQPYLRGLLDKLGVRPEVLTCGDYKSAGEIFVRTGPSPEADKMMNWLLDSIYDTSVRLIAEGRGVSAEKARLWIDDGPYTAERAKAAGLIDAVEHRQDFLNHLRKTYGEEVSFEKRYGREKPPQLDFSSPFAMFKIWADMMKAQRQKGAAAKQAVGVVYVDGPIVVGRSRPSFFGISNAAMSSDVRRALDRAANDEKIKAVVLRVDSPGGSAVASEIILDATRRVKAKKPLVVSMGNVAGSGGYYVTCAADTVFADESTITGSIGVVGAKLVTTEMWNKVGITFKEYKRGANAGLMGTSEPWSEAERKRVQGWMDEIYKTFKGHVVAARGAKLKKPIDEIAGGRVYTGRQALELGLVDKIGSLQDAVEFAAKQAKIEDYDVRAVPQPKNFLELLMEGSGGGDQEENKWIESARGATLDAAALSAAPLAERGGSIVDVAMPYLKQVDPQRVGAIRTALVQLEMLRREGVGMVMQVPVVGGR